MHCTQIHGERKATIHITKAVGKMVVFYIEIYIDVLLIIVAYYNNNNNKVRL